ncbi:MAG: phosphoglycerate kinase [Armatimonadetes bacterium]|nr:phosphoglycerate kinase [Armatimonadota bacterium]
MPLEKKTVEDVEVAGKRVLVRCDFNVPLDGALITDDGRIKASLPTIRRLLADGAAVILCSHLGRPKGEVRRELSLAPVARRLSELLELEVPLLPDCIGPAVEEAVGRLTQGQAVLLENLRFHSEEESNDPAFAAELAKLADLFVNDAFGTAHRAHASTVGVAEHLPSVAGLLVKNEIEFLGRALDDPKRPFIAILGGAKVADKIRVIESLASKADKLAIGGGMAFTFLVAQGHEVGRSLLDPESIEFAKELLESEGGKIVLPVDVAVAPELVAGASPRNVGVEDIAPDLAGGDIGTDTQLLFRQLAGTAGTVFWNGPMGVFELEPFSHGTRAVAKSMAESSAVTVIGGGDSAAAVEKFGLSGRYTHVSTGGGASLQLLEGRELPGIAALQDRD